MFPRDSASIFMKPVVIIQKAGQIKRCVATRWDRRCQIAMRLERDGDDRDWRLINKRAAATRSAIENCRGRTNAVRVNVREIMNNNTKLAGEEQERIRSISIIVEW